MYRRSCRRAGSRRRSQSMKGMNGTGRLRGNSWYQADGGPCQRGAGSPMIELPMLRLIALLVLSMLSASLAAEAQPRPEVSRIYVIDHQRAAARFPPAFWERMRELGWVDGQNLQVELRGAGGDWARLLGFAAEIEQGKPNAIVMNNATAARRLQEKVRSVPICVAGGDLQAAGVVANLAKPEGNVTGVQVFQPDLAGKRLALLKEAIPTLTRIA